METKTPTETLSRMLGRYACDLRYEALPPEVVDKARTLVLHGLGTALAAQRGEVAPLAAGSMAWLLGNGGDGPLATELHSGRQVPLGHAVLVNGIQFHHRTQEDTHFAAYSHFGPVVTPILLALAEVRPVTGRELITAMAAAYQVGAALGSAGARESTARGFRATPLYAGFAGAVAAGRVLGLEADAMARAIGLAAHFAGGLNETWVAGTMEYGIQVGMTALHGLMAAKLAQDGADAAPTVLDGRTGFFAAVAGIDDAPARVRKSLDAGWHITRVSLKSFGACQLAQGPITAALALQERHAIDPAQIARIAVRLNPYEVDYPGTAEKGPFTSFAGSLMSVPFSVAAALRHGQVTMAGMTDFGDGLTNRLVQATTVLPDEGLKPLDCGMDIELRDGTKVSDELRTSKDFFNLSYDRDREVLRGLLPEMNLTPAGLEALADTIAGLEHLDSAARILQVVAGHRAT